MEGAMSEHNKAAARAVFDVWSTGEIGRLDDLVAPDVVHHDPYDPRAAEGLDGLKRSIAATHARFPDFRISVADQVAEGDRVATRWIAQLTRDGTPVSMTGITIERFVDGKVAESWRCYTPPGAGPGG
jgi:ketosteroid isomerase-like protein